MRIRPILAGLAAAGMLAAAAPMAAAAPGNAVAFGDSLTANPSLVDYARASQPGQANAADCPTDGRFAAGYSAASGLHTDDYTCAGASFRTGGMRIAEQVRRATESGALDAGTSQVVLLAGANDTYPYVLNQRMPVPEIQENLRVAVRDTVNQIRAAAPNARIKLVGFPTISAPDGGVCLVNFGPGGARTPGINIREIEDGLQWAVIQAAGDTGVEFVDLKPMSTGHDMCSADRWIVGVIDDKLPYNLTLHLTHAGLDAVAAHAGRA
ncbi:GDSL-type esterase/lipase family protein [Corynebacterium sp. 335C]